MKVLIYQHSKDFRFNYLSDAMIHLGFNVGFTNELNVDAIMKFNPNVMMHNMPNEADLDFLNNDIPVIAFNNMEEYNCFSLDESDHPRYIHPFINLRKLDTPNPIYKSQCSFIGNVSAIEKYLNPIENSGIKLKCYSDVTFPFSCYVGSCTMLDYNDIYAMSDAVIVVDNNSYQILDIIYCNGTPITFNQEEDFLNKLKSVILDKKPVDDEFMSREDILNEHTNFDVISTIMSGVGIKISSFIKSQKETML